MSVRKQDVIDHLNELANDPVNIEILKLMDEDSNIHEYLSNHFRFEECCVCERVGYILLDAVSLGEERYCSRCQSCHDWDTFTFCSIACVEKYAKKHCIECLDDVGNNLGFIEDNSEKLKGLRQWIQAGKLKDSVLFDFVYTNYLI